MAGMDVRQIEVACRAFLANAAARHMAAYELEPETPSVDYVTGFAAGREQSEVQVFALVLSMITGESASGLVQEATARAAVDSVFPFELHMEPLSEPVHEPGEAV